MVYVYSVKNDLTDWETNLFMEKPFMTNGEFLDSLDLNANNVPTINGTGSLLFNLVNKCYDLYYNFLFIIRFFQRFKSSIATIKMITRFQS